MPRFFIDNPLQVGKEIVIEGEDALHIGKSLRMKISDIITLCNQDGYDYECEIIAIDKKAIVCGVKCAKVNLTEPYVDITIYQALPKSDKMEFIIQKAVELGVCEITPCYSDRCVVKLEKQVDAVKKQMRWQKISEQAAKQCGRGKIPTVNMPIVMEEVVEQIQKKDISFVAYEVEEQDPISLKNFLRRKVENVKKEKINVEHLSVGFIIGAEGGFTAEEISYIKDKNISVVSLGKRILRCETAAVGVCAMVIYELDERL